jgi:hypothetical protein
MCQTLFLPDDSSSGNWGNFLLLEVLDSNVDLLALLLDITTLEHPEAAE